jgi:hypothetical protein
MKRCHGLHVFFRWTWWLAFQLVPISALSQSGSEMQAHPSARTLAESCGTQPTPERSLAGQMDEDQVQSLIADLTRMGMHCAALRIRNNNPLKSRAIAKNRAGAVDRPHAKVLAEPATLERGLRLSRQTLGSQAPAEPKSGRHHEAQVLMPPTESQVQSSLGVELMRDTGGWVHVRGFDIAHSSRFPESELQGLLSSFIDKELNVAQLKQATALIGQHYRAKGIVARVLLPEQSIDQGIVKILVLESQRPKAGHVR